MKEYVEVVEKELAAIFDRSQFVIKTIVDEEYTYEHCVDDFFTMYADSLIRFQVQENSGEYTLLDFYLLKSNGSITFYISTANFADCSGRKFGTRVVGLVANSKITNQLMISDRTDTIVPGVTVWSHIVSKYPNIEYLEV